MKGGVGLDCQNLYAAICEQVCTWKMNGGSFVFPDFCQCWHRRILTVAPLASLERMALSPLSL